MKPLSKLSSFLVGAAGLIAGLAGLTLLVGTGIMGLFTVVSLFTAPGIATLLGAGVTAVLALASSKNYDAYDRLVGKDANLGYFTAGAGVAAAGIFTGFFIGLLPLIKKSENAPVKTRIEQKAHVSFITHENAFNAVAQKGKKTLVLTAKDFAAVPKMTLSE
jgi:hypothetical protein